jgi:hypothetical protein
MKAVSLIDMALDFARCQQKFHIKNKQELEISKDRKEGKRIGLEGRKV